MLSRLVAAALAGVTCGCATAARPRVVDLQPARQALEEARAEGAAERAPETFTRAQGELKEAERLVAERGAEAPQAAVQAEWAARLALSEARCATRDPSPTRSAADDEIHRLEARARRSEEEQRRLEEQIALRQRELEVTETELIRTKARLKGLETRAEASSAIAEARILVGRLGSRGRSAAVKLAEESLDKAGQQLEQDNYGAALFFALKAQDLAARSTDTRAAAENEDADRPAPRATYVVTAATANVRQGPSASAAVVGEVRQGTKLTALALRGNWLKISHGDVTGWVSLRLVE